MYELAGIPLNLAQIDAGRGLVATVILIADIVAIISVLGGRGGILHKVLWTALIVFLPVIGLIIYFLVGRNSADA